MVGGGTKHHKGFDGLSLLLPRPPEGVVALGPGGALTGYKLLRHVMQLFATFGMCVKGTQITGVKTLGQHTISICIGYTGVL